MNKTILSLAAVLVAARAIHAADISPGQPYGRPFNDGDKVTAAALNSALAGTINSSFYTGKGSKSVPDPANDLVLMFDLNDLVFYKTTFGTAVLSNTNLVSSQLSYGAGITNSQSLLIFDPLYNSGVGALGQSTISNLLYYSLLYNHNQLALDAAQELTLKSGALITNASFSGTQTGGIFNNAVITNGIATNAFTLGGAASGNADLRFFNSAETTGGRAWDWSLTTGGQLKLQAWDDPFSNPSSSIMTVTRQSGNTNIQSIAFNASSNGVNGVVEIVPAGICVGLNPFQPIAQLNTYDSGTNNAIPANGGTIPFATGFAGAPSTYRLALVCCVANQNYAPGDEVNAEACVNSDNNQPFQVYYTQASPATLVVRRRNGSGTPWVLDKTGGAGAAITVADWSLRVYATYLK